MPTAQDKSAINRMLMSHGLGRLEYGAGLISQLGFLVQDHEHLRSLLARCEPENRSTMYDSLKPYLRFPAKPLDVYMAESAERAASQNLPTHFNEPLTPELGPDVAAAQAAVNDSFAKHTLIGTCRSCTKQEAFTGDTKYDAIVNARLAGWVYYEIDGQPREICPDCPAVRVVS